MSKKRIRKNKNKKFIRGAVSQKRKKVLFTSVNLLGDSIAITPAIATWYLHNQNYDIYLYLQNQAFCRILEGLPFIKQLEYHDKWEPLRTPHKYFRGFEYYHNFSINVAFALGSGNGLHMTESYALALENQPGNNKPLRLRLKIPLVDKIEGIDGFDEEDNIAIAPFSTSSDPESGDFRSSKMLGFGTWSSILDYLTNKYGWKVRVYGTEKDPWKAWESYCGKESNDMKFYVDRPIREVAARLISEETKCILTIDHGLSHVMGATMTRYNRQIPTLFIYPKLPPQWVFPHGMTKKVLVRCEPRRVTYDVIKEKKILEELDSLIKENEEI